MLSVHYGADVPPSVVEFVEHHARLCGASLDQLEIVGSCLDFAEAFIVACEDDHAAAFLAGMGGAPVDRVGLARRQAALLFGVDEARA